MLSKVTSCGLSGIDGYIVSVETDISNGLPAFDIVGLADMAVREAKERVRAAIRNSGFEFPSQRITVNLAPADLKKEGTSYDLPIAAGVLSATGIIPPGFFNDSLLCGELSLDGTLRPVCGVLSKTIAARDNGVKRIIVPSENAYEAAVVKGIRVIPVKNLAELVLYAKGEAEIIPVEEEWDKHAAGGDYEKEPDFADVRGQYHVKRALEVAAAGGHNLLMLGSPGSGKTMLARRMPSILPDMTFDEALEVTKIYSVAGLLPPETSLVRKRPFRAPHHTISAIGLVGGGRIPRPGEVSLAHLGVLFLDELPEFSKNALEVLRQPLEDGFALISRINASITYPCRTTLVAAANPCKCGNYLDETRLCNCTRQEVRNYIGKLSGPLLDRIDIQVEVPSLKYSELDEQEPSEPSSVIRKRVNSARAIQHERFKKNGIYCNSQMTAPMIRRFCRLDKESSALLKEAFSRLSLTARSYNRILKVARTIADLDGTAEIEAVHIAEAIQYRALERGFFA
ncbi:MAG: YifB family Mg chelatase-like AAA ATPase [Clostridiaceae bacterium]|jgi:magnesium chelatase family protein|nr:YifB family Mg chelatase-like AAA ATPase [Clostridiaceae bacterium]